MTEESGTPEQEAIPSLAEAYKEYFPVGVDMEQSVMFPEAEPIVLRHFSSVSPCPEFLFDRIHPSEDEYNWADADRAIEFALKNDKQIQIAHLVWGWANPDWLFKEGDGEVDKGTLLQRMEDHIDTVMTRYKGKVDLWNVVNEPVADPWFNLGEDVEDPGSAVGRYKENDWYRIIGEEYVEKAFHFAREADPEARLVFNEYNLVGQLHASKRAHTYEMLEELLGKGVPIHVFGIQGHWAMDYPDPDDLRETIDLFAGLGLEIQITELDVSSYSIAKWAFPEQIPELEEFTGELEAEQADRYAKIFEVCREKKDVITGVTLWGVSDRWTWLREYPDERNEWPLLFDGDLKTKEAFWRVLRFDS